MLFPIESESFLLPCFVLDGKMRFKENRNLKHLNGGFLEVHDVMLLAEIYVFRKFFYSELFTPEKLQRDPKGKPEKVFQPSISRGQLLNFGCVTGWGW